MNMDINLSLSNSK